MFSIALPGKGVIGNEAAETLEAIGDALLDAVGEVPLRLSHECVQWPGWLL